MLETVFNILKVSVAVVIGGIFLVAINTLLNFISMVFVDTIFHEILIVISDCLPFNASAVFFGLLAAMNAILAFLIAKKIFDLTSWSLSSV